MKMIEFASCMCIPMLIIHNTRNRIVTFGIMSRLYNIVNYATGVHTATVSTSFIQAFTDTS